MPWSEKSDSMFNFQVENERSNVFCFLYVIKKKFILAMKAPKRTLRLRVKFKINAVDPASFNLDTL